ncbi:Uncharacterised protein [Citrobacter koseri]|uniref:Immunity protein 35 domain-containing protein n=1 Tax=Citrobacter koseri (strain ATCC BAA-895 / CDC 4225-83 / SGSC4696) TaxID=290338 RepID=A8AQZ6_CITK8|nr:hypothetical protein CKO_04864 [Citrobacter koseri ATCC BAA-895]SQB06994.1 Uncharacterised protein [Citrobacter koseri]STB46709.1 Uncharacterised protein [Citrobacter koseri]SUX90916.1 Uncharacterised protein [Citrobacter koseri]VFS01358.1 Uncharacterised protein [Citrobacter koseri]
MQILLSSSHSTEDLQKVVFCFESMEYLETGDNASRLAGNTPFIIDKDSGEIFDLGTAWPLEKYLKDYEESKKARS